MVWGVVHGIGGGLSVNSVGVDLAVSTTEAY